MLHIIRRGGRLAACLTLAALLQLPAAAATPPSGDVRYYGVDIFHGTAEQGRIDWPELAATQDFLYFKVSEGENWEDPMYRTYLQQASAHGIPWGTYHYLRIFGVESARRQAVNYWNRIQGTGYALVPAVDIETLDGKSAAEVRACTRAFIDTFRELSGSTPLLYTYTSFAATVLGDGFTDCGLWLADYRASTGDVAGWKSWNIWQYSESGRISAISGEPVDLNRATASIFLNGTPSGLSPALQTQKKLNLLQISRPLLAEDGIIGPKSRAATRVFEQVYGLTVDTGIWGPQCEAAYGRVTAEPLLSSGSRGSVVRYLQYRLDIRIDGIFGPQTQTAVRTYQRAHGLAADGIVGPLTWQSLLG